MLSHSFCTPFSLRTSTYGRSGQQVGGEAARRGSSITQQGRLAARGCPHSSPPRLSPGHQHRRRSAVCFLYQLRFCCLFINSASAVVFPYHLGVCPPPPCLISTSSSYYNFSPSDPSLDLAITLALQSLQQQNYLQAFIKHNFATALAHATSSTSLSKPYMSRHN